MKILFVLTYYRPHWTGLTQYAARLAESLAASGENVKVLCVKHDINLPEKEEINKVSIFRIRFNFIFTRSLVALGMMPKLFSLSLKSDVVIIYLPFLEVLPSSIILKILGKKFYLVHNGDLVMPTESGFVKYFLEKVYYLTSAISIMLSDGIVVQTDDYADNSLLLSKIKKKRHIILPLYDNVSVNKKNVERFVNKYRLKGKKLVGFSGRFVEEKGIDFLLKAIPDVISKIPNVFFVFAGETKIRYEKFWGKIEPLIEKNRNNIRLLGLLTKNEEMVNFYSSLSVLVQPSRSDCFPSSLVEAILTGTPAVCTDIPGTRWIIKTSGMGILVKPRSSKALAEGIIEVLKNRDKYIENKNKVREIFNNRIELKKYAELFKN